MCKAIEDMINEAVNYERIKMSIELLKEKMSFDIVSEISGLPLAEVEKLAETAIA